MRVKKNEKETKKIELAPKIRKIKSSISTHWLFFELVFLFPFFKQKNTPHSIRR